jgi:sugar/nucleoside kinase (ribokinase family)
MIAVLGDVIADLGLRIGRFPLDAGALARASSFMIGPGGACNIAIESARLGLDVASLGEVGNDTVGSIVVQGLRDSGIDTSSLVITEGGETPVAGVIVDDDGEAAYAGYGGTLRVTELTKEWRDRIRSADALFADGWADHDYVGPMILDAFAFASENDVPTFFDAGPGNPELDNAWHVDAARRATVVMATEAEADRLTGEDNGRSAAGAVLEWGAELVVIKRGPGGCLLARDGELHLSPSFPVQVVDTTGAGDGVDAIVIYGYLRGLELEELGVLANAVGAAKVKKSGTGLHMPTVAEIRAVLEEFGRDTGLLPGSPMSL